MRNKLIFLCLAAALMSGLWCLSRKGQPRPSQSADNNTVKDPPPKQIDAPRNAETNNISKTASEVQPTRPATTHAELVGEMNVALEAKNIAFNFYGRTVDQNSNGLPAVMVKVWVRHWQSGSRAGIWLTRITDDDGNFVINNVTGDAFDIESFVKDGFELEPGQKTFGPMGGSPDAPVLFKMWSTNTHQELITGGKPFQPLTDGRPYSINLADGSVSESGTGDLKVWIQYTNQPVRGQIHDWSCGVEVANGGLFEEVDCYSAMYVAPVEGYKPMFHFEQQIKGGQRGSSGTRRFYLMLENGRIYGRMQIEFIAPYNPSMGKPALLHLSYALNPSGSRILR